VVGACGDDEVDRGDAAARDFGQPIGEYGAQTRKSRIGRVAVDVRPLQGGPGGGNRRRGRRKKRQRLAQRDDVMTRVAKLGGAEV
jgi:hypothetical protein